MTEKKRLFGTNGVRGIANEDMNIELAMRLGSAIGTYLGSGAGVAIGTDCRTSNEMLTSAVGQQPHGAPDAAYPREAGLSRRAPASPAAAAGRSPTAQGVRPDPTASELRMSLRGRRRSIMVPAAAVRGAW